MSKRSWTLVAILVAACAAWLLPPAANADVRASLVALKRAAGAGDQDAVRGALEELIAAGGSDAAEGVVDLAERIPPGHESLYWLLMDGAASFTDAAALESLADFLVKRKSKPVSRDLLFALQNNSDVATVVLHRRVMADCPEDMAMLSIDSLSTLRAVETVDALIEAMEAYEGDREERLVMRCAVALTGLTGRPIGQRVSAWKVWWKANRANGLPEPEEADTSHSGTAVDHLDPVRGSSFAGLKENPADRVLVIKGQCRGKHANEDAPHTFDHIEQMLDRMEIPHRVVGFDDIQARDFDLSKSMAILFNCILWRDHCVCPTCVATGGVSQRMQSCGDCDVHDNVNHLMGQDGMDKLKAWVGGGGYLFTEDLILESVVERIWPDLLRKQSYLDTQNVKIVAARGLSAHPYLRRVFVAPKPVEGIDGRGTVSGGSRGLVTAEHAWQIDQDTPAFEIRDARRVQPLLWSDALAAANNGNGNVAVTFGYFQPGASRGSGRPSTGGGRNSGGSSSRGSASEFAPGGRVLHCLSHFGKQQGDAAGELALQNLILNFLLEAQERWVTQGR